MSSSGASTDGAPSSSVEMPRRVTVHVQNDETQPAAVPSAHSNAAAAPRSHVATAAVMPVAASLDSKHPDADSDAKPDANREDDATMSPRGHAALAARRCAEPIAIQFQNLTATLQEKNWKGTVIREHTILKNISARFEPGKLIGIMGGSGSGKTSLLNLLANRGGVRQSCKCSGSILFNGRPGDQYGNARAAPSVAASSPSASAADADVSSQNSHNSLLENRIGYVLQQEYLLPHLSVFETLMYAAQLRLSRQLSTAQKRARVEEIILELNLKAVRDSLVGDENVRGISGGERRRVSVAVQMLIDPSVLFLDEPTTGLDAFTALNIVETLAGLAHAQGRTVIATIHQPRASIYSTFDEIMLMVRGQVVFRGSPADSIAFFEAQGYVIPAEVNPVDHMLDILTIDGRSEIKDPNAAAEAVEAEETEADAEAAEEANLTPGSAAKAATISRRERAGLARVRRLKRAFDAQQKQKPDVARLTSVERADLTPVAEAASSKPSPEPMTLQGARTPTQILLLVRRTFLHLLRDRYFLGAQFISNVFIALMMGCLFYQLPDSTSGVRSRLAATYMVSLLNYYLQMIWLIYRFSSVDLPIADHERTDGMYSAFSFVVSTFLSYLPFHVIFSTIYMSIAYFMIGFRTDDGSAHFWISTGIAIMMIHCCAALSLMCVCLQRSFAQASLTANSYFTFFGLSTGFLINSESIPVYLKWIQSLAYTWYGWRVMASNEFSGRTLHCNPAEQPSGSCEQFEGSRILHDATLGVNDYQAPFIALMVFWAVCTTISYLALVFIPQQSQMAGEGATLGSGASAGVDEKEYDLDAKDDESESQPVAVALKKTAPLNEPVLGLRPSAPVHPAASPLDTAVDRSTSCVRFHAGPDDEETEAISLRVDDGRSPLPARSASPLLTSAAPNGHASGLPSGQSKSLGVPRLSNDGGKISYRPLITVTLNNLCLSVVKRRALDLGGFGFGSSDASSKLSAAERNKPLKILNGVTATIESGKLVVLMGSSGSGKSTLLDIISHRSTLLDKLEGDVLFNGAPLEKNVWESVVGYVMQADHLLPFLTVEETLRFAAHLRLPPDTTRKEREARVAAVIAELGLQLCKHTLVGSKEVKGISGGEKRRLSIGVQMLTDPSVLLLDEPTSGLDSFTAHQITRTLSRIAKRGRTVLCSIHQPRSDVYALFDRIMLLAPGGSLVYYGSRASVAPYFAAPPLSMHSTEAHANPADWLLDHSSLDYRTPSSEERTIARNKKLVEQFKRMQSRGLMIDGNDEFRSEADVGSPISGDHSKPLLSPALSNGDVKRGSAEGQLAKKQLQLQAQQPQGDIALVRRAPFGLAFGVLLSRSWLNFKRQPQLMSTRIGQIVAFAVILMLYYTRLGFDQNSVQNRLGLIQQFTALLFIGMLNNVAIFPAERNIFYREYADRSYGTLAFFLSYTLAEVVFEVIGSVLFAVIAMYVIGMQASATTFFILLYTLFCAVQLVQRFAILRVKADARTDRCA